MRRKRNRRTLIITAIVAAVVATSAYAFTNTIGGVAPPSVGSGSGPIGTYTASAISYTLSPTNPLNLNQVSFNLANSTAATAVQISLDGTTWYSCVMGTPPAVTCATTAPQATAASATNMTIVAQK
jgi:hypothetical protein